MSGVDEGGNSVEIEVTVPSNSVSISVVFHSIQLMQSLSHIIKAGGCNWKPLCLRVWANKFLSTKNAFIYRSKI